MPNLCCRICGFECQCPWSHLPTNWWRLRVGSKTGSSRRFSEPKFWKEVFSFQDTGPRARKTDSASYDWKESSRSIRPCLPQCRSLTRAITKWSGISKKSSLIRSTSWSRIKKLLISFPSIISSVLASIGWRRRCTFRRQWANIRSVINEHALFFLQSSSFSFPSDKGSPLPDVKQNVNFLLDNRQQCDAAIRLSDGLPFPIVVHSWEEGMQTSVEVDFHWSVSANSCQIHLLSSTNHLAPYGYETVGSDGAQDHTRGADSHILMTKNEWRDQFRDMWSSWMVSAESYACYGVLQFACRLPDRIVVNHVFFASRNRNWKWFPPLGGIDVWEQCLMLSVKSWPLGC